MSNNMSSAMIPADELLPFDSATFDTDLRRLLAMPSVGEVRDAVADLRRQWLVAANDGAAEALGAGISFPRSYLADQLDQIAAALTIERAHYYIERLRRSAGEPRTNGVNDLDLNRWKAYSDIQTDSLWQIDRRDTTGAHTAGYWGNFVPQIPNQMMRRYTKKSDWVLDAFAGSGTSLIEARRLGRNCLGVELQAHVAERARTTLAAEPNPNAVVSMVETGDSASFDFSALLTRHGQRAAQLALLHPPYHDIIRFSDNAADLSNAPTVASFLDQLGAVVENVAAALERERYLVLVIGDKYVRGEWHPLGFQAMQVVQDRGFLLKSIVVKNFDATTGKRAQKELWRYRALAGGFFVFKHEYIFVFEKR